MEQSKIATSGTDFFNALSRFVQTIAQAIAAYEEQNNDRNAFSYKQWKDTAIPLLEKDRLALGNALSSWNSVSEKIVRQIASNEVALSKNLDTFDFGFVDDFWAKKLDDGVTEVVMTASKALHAR